MVLKRRNLDPICATVFNYGLRKDISYLVNFEDVYPYLADFVSDRKLKEINEWYDYVKNFHL